MINSTIGLKSETINYTTQGSGCYINLFEAIRYDKDQVEIHLNLGTLFQVDHVVIYKTINNQSEVFTTLDLKNTQFNLTDAKLISGWMDYQAEVFLSDGTSLKSDVSSVFIETKGKAVVYPNPVTNDYDLTVISEGNGLLFKIIDNQGKHLLTKEVNLIKEQFDISELLPGLYMYQLIDNNEIKDSGRFVKL